MLPISALLLFTLAGPIDPVPPVPPVPAVEPVPKAGPEREAAEHEGAPVVMTEEVSEMRVQSRFGLDKTDCGPPRPSVCGATDVTVLVGVGGANFGGFGLGFEADAMGLLSSGSFGGKAELDVWGHFNGLGQQTATQARPPVGELSGTLTLAAGFVDYHALAGGWGPFVMLDPVQVQIASLDGAKLVSITPNLELGIHGSTGGHAVRSLSLHLGGNAFAGDGVLQHLESNGLQTAWVLDPYVGLDALADFQLSPTVMLRLRGQLSWTLDSFAPGVQRQILAAHFEAIVKFGPFLTGPSYTLFSPSQQVVGGRVTGAAPETDFLWSFGF